MLELSLDNAYNDSLPVIANCKQSTSTTTQCEVAGCNSAEVPESHKDKSDDASEETEHDNRNNNSYWGIQTVHPFRDIVLFFLRFIRS